MLSEFVLAEFFLHIIVSVVFAYVAKLIFSSSKFSHTKTEYLKCREELYTFINNKNCNPIFVRLAWHDSGTFDKNVKSWPKCGGANGSIRFSPELNHGANAGLSKAVRFLSPFKDRFPLVSWADLIQMASAVAIEHAGGPIIEMKYGRVSIHSEKDCPAEGNLPDGNQPFGDDANSGAEHLRNIFHRMGFSDQEIVCLSGAHTLGRGFKTRSGVCEFKENGKGTKFTSKDCIIRPDQHPGFGITGGQSWTADWLTFNNSYFQYREHSRAEKKQLLWMETDSALYEDEAFKKWFDVYAEDQEKFFEDYALVHKKLSELGCKFENGGFSL